MTSLLTERERKAIRQLFKPMFEMLALPWAIVLVLAVLAGVLHFVGLPATEIVLNVFLQAVGLLLFFQGSLLLVVGVIVAWRFVTERHRVKTFLSYVADRLDLRATRLARRWSRILREVCFPIRLATPPGLRLVWRDQATIIGSRFVAGDTPKLE